MDRGVDKKAGEQGGYRSNAEGIVGTVVKFKTDSTSIVKIGIVWGIPLLALLVYFRMFAPSLPYWDEWFYVRHVLRLQDYSIFDVSDWAKLMECWPVNFREHKVAIPFLLYWPVCTVFHFDSRWVIGLIVLLFLVKSRLYCIPVRHHVWSQFPCVLVVLSTSHYMEFLWGWQITITLSVLFAIGGIFVVSKGSGLSESGFRIRRGFFSASSLIAASWALLSSRITISSIGFLFAFYSSTSGIFGFIVGIPLLYLSKYSHRERVCGTVVYSLLFWFCFMSIERSGEAFVSVLSLRNFVYVFYSIGALLFSCAEGVYDLHVIGYVIAGVSVCLLIGIWFFRVWRSGDSFQRYSLPVGYMLYGFFCIYSISASREYVGNWHLQHVIPIVCGAYAASFILKEFNPDRWSYGLYYSFWIVCMSSVIGSVSAFSVHGPFQKKAMDETAWMFPRHLEAPSPKFKRLENAFGLSIDEVLFLSAYGHPVFSDDRAASWVPVDDRVNLSVFFGGDLVLQSRPGHFRIPQADRSARLLAVVEGNDSKFKKLKAVFGDRELILRKIDPIHFEPSTDFHGDSCYAGWLMPSCMKSDFQILVEPDVKCE
jgi:hypothetical protein